MIDRRAFALGLAATAASCARGPNLDRLTLGEQGRAVGVRSGEVLNLDSGLEVRLAGIEAPNGSEPLANEARVLLSAAVLGKPVTLLYGGLKRDRYERALAHVRLEAGRRWMQGEVLAAGLARVRTYPDNRALAAEMLEAEARARRAKKGLWAIDAYRVLLPYECPGKSGFQIVEGKVRQVAVTSGSVLLDFQGGGARAEVPRFVSADFAAAGHAPEGLKDRLIRVRGNLRDGVIRLDHPETLEMLRN